MAVQNYLPILEQKGIIEAVLAVFTTPLGAWFYVIMIFLIEIMIYMKTQDVTLPAIVGLIISAASLAFLPVEVHKVAYGLLALSIAVILYKVFVR
jgi:hypothetical protein